jgi:hypothetical protein
MIIELEQLSPDLSLTKSQSLNGNTDAKKRDITELYYSKKDRGDQNILD